MRNRVGTGILVVFILFSFFSKPGSLFAQEKTDSSGRGPVILLISRMNETPDTAEKHPEQNILIYARLKYSLALDLTERGLTVFSSDDNQERQEADYVLTYTIDNVKFGFKHPFGQGAKIDVRYEFATNNGETVSSGHFDAKSIISLKSCVSEISARLAESAAEAIADRAPVDVFAETGEVLHRSDLPSPPGPESGPAEPAVEKSDAVSLGVSGLMTDAFDDWGHALFLSYEKRLGFINLITAYAKVGYVGYQVDNEFYSETARGSGAEIGIRFYPDYVRLRGWYIGVGAGLWRVSGTWKDDLGTPFVTAGNGRTSLSVFNIHTGYKIFFGSGNFYLDPSLEYATFSSNGTPGAFGEISQTVEAGVSAGIAW